MSDLFYMWGWVGAGIAMVFLLLLALLWLCKLFNILPRNCCFSNRGVTRRSRLTNLTLTLTREVTQINGYTENSSLSHSPTQAYHKDPVFGDVGEEYSNACSQMNAINTHFTQHIVVHRNLTTADHFFSEPFKKSRSLYDGFPSRSMSRILWQDLTITSTDNAIVEQEFTEREKESITSREGNLEIRKIIKSSRRIFRQAWGSSSVKIFLFAKLVAGYFTVDRSGKLCKVNDWRHVSGRDLRYREKAIFDLVCLNQLQIEIFQ